MLDLELDLAQASLVFLDVETTGLDPSEGDRVCEIALVRYEHGQAQDALHQLINPQRPVSLGAFRVHGLSDEMLRDAPPFAHVAQDVLELLHDAVLVGHNTPFDLGFLAAELGRLGLRLPPLIALDTLRLARRAYRLPSYALGAVAQALGIAIAGQTHRAMQDVLLTRGVWERLVADLCPLGLRSIGDFLRAQGGELNFAQPVPIEAPPAIQRALQENLLLRLRYLAESGQETERIVRPLAVMDYGGHATLVAHCLLRDARRHFRLDRILELELITDWR